MPRRRARRGFPSSMGLPSRKISPEVAVSAPERILTRVDFPAPFSPEMACTSPEAAEKSTFRRACVPSKFLLIPRITRNSEFSIHKSLTYAGRGKSVMHDDRFLISHLFQRIMDALPTMAAHFYSSERQGFDAQS